ncbi:MAG: hypothetical protein JHD33_01015 [Chthoniobacterales bacterium]|nr:hypothetical protein [Chthoniobacterales bacterium]
MNRARQENAAGLGLLARWIAVVVFVGLLGLCYVQMKQRLATDGNLCRDLENTVRELDEKLLVVNTNIRRFTGRPSLERRREEGFIRMIDVTDSRIVRLREQTEAAALPAKTAEARP